MLSGSFAANPPFEHSIMDATAARNAEFLDTLIATCHLDRDARARKGGKVAHRAIAADAP